MPSCQHCGNWYSEEDDHCSCGKAQAGITIKELEKLHAKVSEKDVEIAQLRTLCGEAARLFMPKWCGRANCPYCKLVGQLRAAGEKK